MKIKYTCPQCHKKVSVEVTLSEPPRCTKCKLDMVGDQQIKQYIFDLGKSVKE